MSSLEHHGIKGQKWGVRRFQNPDGTRTSAGREHDRETRLRGRLIRYGMRYVQDNTAYAYRSQDLAKINKNIKVQDEHTDILKKGTVFNRFTDTKEQLDNRRKYVSFTDNDLDFYEEQWGPHSLYREQYKAKRDLRIANGKAVTKLISDLEKTDPKSISKGKNYAEALSKVVENTAIEEAYSDARSGKLPVKDMDLARKIYEEALMKNIVFKDTNHAYDLTEGALGKALVKRIRDIGYDGYADVNDARYDGYSAEYPLVILDPKKKVSLKKRIEL